MTLVDHEIREHVKTEIDRRRRAQAAAVGDPRPRSRLSYSRSLGNEVARQHLQNDIPPEVIADLLGLTFTGVRKMLRSRGIGVEHLPARVAGGRVNVPERIRRHLDPDGSYQCELTADGFRYRKEGLL